MSKFRWFGKSEDGETILLRKFKGEFLFQGQYSNEWLVREQEFLQSICVVDVETTGLDFRNSSIIEIGIRKVVFDLRTKLFVGIVEGYQGFQDPGKPLSKEIIELTGIEDKDLKGKQIDWAKVESLFQGSQMIIAHNAAFDRPFIEKHSQIAQLIPWGCSMSQIDWATYGYPSKKLEILSLYHGFFVDAHRALTDVDALVHLLSFSPDSSGAPYFSLLLEAARRKIIRLAAEYAPFAVKDLLKGRGYSWDMQSKYWYKKLVQEQLETEIHWMEENIYQGKFRGSYQEIPIEKNFSNTGY